MHKMKITLFLILLLPPCQLVARQATTQADERADSDWVRLHQSDDVVWAQMTRMPVADLRRLRLAAGIADSQPLVRIETINVRTLPHERILFAAVWGIEHCLRVGIYERKGKGYRELWSVREMPDGAGFCRESPCTGPGVSATKKGEVRISVPVHDKHSDVEACDHVRVFTYLPSGKTYELASERTVPARCGLDTYQQALDIVFGRALGGERLATVQILPSFQPETAIAIEKTPNGLVFTRLTFRKQLWAQLRLGAPGPDRKPSQCIELAKAASVDRTPLLVPRELAQQLIDELAKIDFASDRCPRNKHGACVGVLDGVSYLVQFKTGPSVRLTDVGASSGMRSENPALSKWVTELVKETSPAEAR